MGWKYDHVDYTELSTNGWEVHGTWSGQMVYYQYYLPKGLDITSLSYAWPPQGAAGKPGLVSHDLFAILKGRREPGARAPVHPLHVRAGQRAHELHVRGVPAPPELAGQAELRCPDGSSPKPDYTIVTEDMPLRVLPSWSWPPAVTSSTNRSTKKSRVAP